MALKDISRDCSDSMRPYAGQVIDAIHRSTVSGCLNPGECVRLMYPLGKMLSLLQPPHILPRLQPILFPHLQVGFFTKGTVSLDEYHIVLISNCVCADGFQGLSNISFLLSYTFINFYLLL
jgi:hypothetical protein